jgi:hypothetical protein
MSNTEGGNAKMIYGERDKTELVPGALVDCPTCGLPAEITDRFTLDGVPEPLDHVKVVCVRRHWYTLPVDMVPVSARRTAQMTLRM